jgi:hypothetical protein
MKQFIASFYFTLIEISVNGALTCDAIWLLQVAIHLQQE